MLAWAREHGLTSTHVCTYTYALSTRRCGCVLVHMYVTHTCQCVSSSLCLWTSVHRVHLHTYAQVHVCVCSYVHGAGVGLSSGTVAGPGGPSIRGQGL